MTPKVSIIMPVKNIASYIQDCIASIQSQSFTNWELHIVNDHSTDGTLDLLDKYVHSDTRIKAYDNQGSGIIAALDLALNNCEGQFITRFDGDDIMPEGRLQLMVEALISSPPKTIVTGKVKYFGDQPISKGYQTYEGWINERIDQEDHWNWIYRECVIASPNWMMQTDELKAIAPFERNTYPEDYDLVFQWYHHGFTIKSLKATTLHWREHPERTSRNSSHYDQEHFFRLKLKHFVENEIDSETLVLWGTDVKGKLTAQLLDEMKVPFQWMELDKPNRPKAILGHAISDYRLIEKMSNIKLLISVFPPTHQRVRLARYLSKHNLRHGYDYHYL